MKLSEMVQYVGMDVHKDSIVFAVFVDEENEPRTIVKKRNEWTVVRKYFENLKDKGHVITCYEAGPCGYLLQRKLKEMGIGCIIAAPGLIPRKMGDHKKTDRRDAINLARNLRNGEITPIYIPKPEDESVRDFLRMRDDIKRITKQLKQQILGLILRKGFCHEGSNWTQRHRKWLQQVFDKGSLDYETFLFYYTALLEQEERLARLGERIEELAAQESYREQVGLFRCFKGIDTYTALSLIVEIGDFKRFRTSPQFMAFLGLTPIEHSSGGKRKLGGITKSGNRNIRRLLVEASWHYSKPNTVSKRLSGRRKGQDEEIISYSEKAGRRLHKKYHKVALSHNNKKIAVVAVARELAGFVWGMALKKVS